MFANIMAQATQVVHLIVVCVDLTPWRTDKLSHQAGGSNRPGWSLMSIAGISYVRRAANVAIQTDNCRPSNLLAARQRREAYVFAQTRWRQSGGYGGPVQ